MANETVITVVGNLTADPELRYTQSGVPVANFTVASTPKVFDRQSGEWKDGDALFLRCSVWREFAEHVAGSLVKGVRVVVQGRLTQRSYQDRDGARRTSIEVQVDEIGPSLRYATATVTRAAGRNQPQEPAGRDETSPEGSWSSEVVSGAQTSAQPFSSSDGWGGVDGSPF